MTDSEQIEESTAFLAGVRFFLRVLFRPEKARSPGYHCELTWGPSVVHGLDGVVQPLPETWTAFATLVKLIRVYRPNVNVRVVLSGAVQLDPAITIPIQPPVTAYPAAPVPGADNIPDPRTPPVQCWPCQGKILIA